MPGEPDGAAAFLRTQGLHVVEVQVDSQCLRHSLNNLMLGTERVAHAESIELVGLSQETAERLPNNSDRGYWDLEMIKVFGSAMFGTRYIVETRYFHEQYGDAEFKVIGSTLFGRRSKTTLSTRQVPSAWLELLILSSLPSN